MLGLWPNQPDLSISHEDHSRLDIPPYNQALLSEAAVTADIPPPPSNTLIWDRILAPSPLNSSTTPKEPTRFYNAQVEYFQCNAKTTPNAARIHVGSHILRALFGIVEEGVAWPVSDDRYHPVIRD
jgi:hypothetical protein